MKHESGHMPPIGGEIRDVIGNLRRQILDNHLSVVELGSVININAILVERLTVLTEQISNRLTDLEERVYNNGTQPTYLP